MSDLTSAVEPGPDGGPSGRGTAGAAASESGSGGDGIVEGVVVPGPDTDRGTGPGTAHSTPGRAPRRRRLRSWRRVRVAKLGRPVGKAVGLYRRSIQLRVVATTLILSVGVVLLLGVVVMNQVRNGLLETKRQAAVTQALEGMNAAQSAMLASVQAVQKSGGSGAASAASGVGQPSTGAPSDTGGAPPLDMGQLLGEEVGALSSSGAGAYSVFGMVPTEAPGESATDSPGSRGARGSGPVDPTATIQAGLRAKVTANEGQAQYQYVKITYTDGKSSEAGMIVARQSRLPGVGPYQLYYVFPFSQESKTLGLVGTTLATAGVFVVILLGAISWLVVRQVVTPVRMAAEIAERLASGRLEERMKVTGTDDIARLGESFNRMAGALQTQIRQLEELSRVQRRFVSDVSHELRTPLTTVRMAADLLYESREDFGDAAAERSAELLQTQLDRFESLLADLLEISRFDAGAAILDAEPTDLREVVARVIDAADPLAQAKGSTVHVLGAEEPVLAEVDPRRIERILRNLVVNALEHGEGRDLEVRLAAGDGAVAVGVRDHGIGLKPGEAARVFNRFWRADPARARTTGGTGLGLSIALEDAALHGGWLQAWGEPGGGSQFRLTVPRNAGGEITRSPIPLEPADSRRNRGLEASGVPFRRTRTAAGALGGAGAVEAEEAPPVTLGPNLGPGLGGVLGYGSVLPVRQGGRGPASNPADVRSLPGIGTPGAQVVVSKEGRDEGASRGD